TMIGDKYTIFSNTTNSDGDSLVSFAQYNSELQMIYTISYNRGFENKTQVDDNVPQLEYLSNILSYDSDDAIKIFIHRSRKYSSFFVLNERGSLIMYRKRNEFYGEYSTGLILFAENTAKYIIAENPDTTLTKDGNVIKAYLMNIDSSGKSNIIEYDYANDAALAPYMTKKNMPITLYLYLLQSGDLGYSFTLPDGGNSDILSRAEIEEISHEISVLMNNFITYTFYPTSVNLENLEIKMYSQYTSLAFSEKNRFELLIEKNLGLI
ncbi:MAG: hypothetical protein FWG49_03790, partial [Leptospirales bacterium]|nr:hypothetical protein [Leptospirales bacterium]